MLVFADKRNTIHVGSIGDGPTDPYIVVILQATVQYHILLAANLCGRPHLYATPNDH